MFDLFCGVLPALSVIFKLGYEPDDTCFYELTVEQYEEAWRQGHAKGSRLYMLLPQQGNVSTDGVFVVTEIEKGSLLEARKIIDQYCAQSGKQFVDYSSKLKYVAGVLPPVFSDNTDSIRCTCV
jgi:hypothetical protein